MSRQTRTGRVLVAVLLSTLAFLLATSVTQAAPASMTRVEHEALVGGGNLVFVNDFEAGDGTQPWLAVGYVVDSDGARNPTAWSSADGVTWTRHAMPDTSSAERRDGPMIVERREGVAVAVGNRFDGSLRAAAWWSTAPGTWNAVPVSDPLAAYLGIVEGVDVGPDAFYAAGYRHLGSHTTVTVFRSTDGRSWTEYSSFSTPANESLIAMDIAVSDSRMVVVGGSQSSTGERDAQIWVRTDGAWLRVDPTGLDMAGAGFQFAGAVAWQPAHGFVAGGISAVGTDSPTLWYSATGATWERLPILSGGPAGVHRVIAVPGGFMAAGLADAGPRVWRSGDGRNWSAVPTPASGGLQGGRARVGSDGTKILYSVTRRQRLALLAPRRHGVEACGQRSGVRSPSRTERSCSTSRSRRDACWPSAPTATDGRS